MSFTVALLSALWLGLLTSVSPCPLASNIAAISFIGRKAHDPRQVLLSGVLYAAGRTAAYVALGALVMTGLLASGTLSRFLQQYLNQILDYREGMEPDDAPDSAASLVREALPVKAVTDSMWRF